MHKSSGLILALALSISPALAQDLPVVHFEPSAADKAIHYARPDIAQSWAQPRFKRKRGKLFRLVQVASITSYFTGSAVQGAARGYVLTRLIQPQPYVLNTSAPHGFIITGSAPVLTVQQLY